MDALEIVVVGSEGRMGKMLARRWVEAGHVVRGLEVFSGDPAELLVPAQAVVLCVPATAMPSALDRICPLLRSEQLLMDICSVKMQPMRWMEERFTGPVVGSHPLFGPEPAKADLRAVLTPGRNCPAGARLIAERLYADLDSATFWSTPEEHDAGVAMAQSLNFAMHAAFLATLARRPDIWPYLTPSFKRTLEAARKHLTQDRVMFCEFTGANPAFPAALAAYREVLEEAASGELAGLATEAAVWYGREIG